MERRIGNWITASTLVFTALSMNACDKPKGAAPASSASARSAADRSGLVDPNLGKALAATKKGASESPGKATDEGPPKNGLLREGKADSILATSAAPLVKLGTQGQKASWHPPAVAALPKQIRMSVATMLGPRRGLPTVDLGFHVKRTDKAKRNKDAGPVGPMSFALKLKDAKLDADQPGQIPDAFKAEVAKMNGSEAQLKRSVRGGLFDVGLQFSKKARGELQQIVAAGLEGMLTFVPAWPDKPIGQGATWIVTNRDRFVGLDVVSYRMYSVKKMDDQSVHLTCQIRQYAASSSLDKPGLPSGTKLLSFQSTGSSEIVVTKKDGRAEQGKMQLNTQYGLQVPNQPGKAAAMVFLSTVTLVPSTSKSHGGH